MSIRKIVKTTINFTYVRMLETRHSHLSQHHKKTAGERPRQDKAIRTCNILKKYSLTAAKLYEIHTFSVWLCECKTVLFSITLQNIRFVFLM